MNTGFCLLSNYGFIQVSGPDAESFLQGQLTCDLKHVTPNQGTLGASCNLKGRVIALFYLAKQSETSYLLRMPKDVIPLVLGHLKQFALFSKVELSDHSEQLSIIGLAGSEVISSLSIDEPKVNDVTNYQNGLLTHPAENFFELWLPSTDQTIATLSNEQATLDRNGWELNQVNALIPEVTAKTSAELTPHELNLPALDAVHFDKGCYQGQEIVARMHYRGTLKQHLYRARLSTAIAIEPNDKLSQDERTVGYVVRGCQLAESTELLVLCKDKAKQDGEVKVAGQLVGFE